MDQRGAARVCHQLAAQSNQPTRRNAEFHAHAPGIVVHHFFHFAAAVSQQLHHDADEIFRAVHDQQFQRLEPPPVFRAHHDFRLAHHQLVTFAPHRLDQNRQLQFAAAQHAKCVGGSGVFHAQRHIGQ